MKNNLYTLKEKKNTEELHLFNSEKRDNDETCYVDSSSICNKMKYGDSSRTEFTCKTEKEARNECAKIGRSVCGTCVSSLYNTY